MMKKSFFANGLKSKTRSRKRALCAFALAVTNIAIGVLTISCGEQKQTETPDTTKNTASSSSKAAEGGSDGLKLGALLPQTGDLGSIGQHLPQAIRLVVDKVNKECAGVNGKPVELFVEDDQTNPEAGTAAMTKLVEQNKVAGVVGSFASSVSTAALSVAVKNKVMLISPGSTSPVFTEKAKTGEFNGFWARTAPPDVYQAQALAKLAYDKGFKKAATIVINNDYGVGFEKEFVKSFKALGGTIVNESKPNRYDAKATDFTSDVTSLVGAKPDVLAAILYVETGTSFLKTAYQQGLKTQILLTDGVYAPTFPEQVGKNPEGKYILEGALGTVPGASGVALKDFTDLWTKETKKELTAYLPHAWDAAALLMLAAEASKQNTGEGIKSKLRDVANGPGEEVSDVCQGLKLIREGKDINYQGASSNVDIDENGDVVGSYDVWTVKPDGKLAVTDKINLESSAKPDAKPSDKSEDKSKKPAPKLKEKVEDQPSDTKSEDQPKKPAPKLKETPSATPSEQPKN
ncbi:MAG TPA: ABC transporter substrate-binding protein [Allocoleopsis sp.]